VTVCVPPIATEEDTLALMARAAAARRRREAVLKSMVKGAW
jgi:hypothetical protein